MKSRLPLPAVEAMDDDQRAVHDSILATRGNIAGPFLAWLHSPEFASRAERLGAFCRYETALRPIESELLILAVAGRLNCIAEQQIHEPIAKAAGLPDSAVSALRDGRNPLLDDERLQLLADFVCALLDTNRVPDPLYQRAVSAFGVRTIVEAAGIAGYYAMVAMTLNTFDMRADA